jgi:aspartyl protease family protein
MPVTGPDWMQMAIYAVVAAVVIMAVQRIPVVGKVIRFAFSLGLLAFLIFILLQQAPYQPTLARITEKLGLDDQQVVGKEVRVKMASDGHFWVKATINGVPRRMLIDSGATITALSEQSAQLAHVATGTGTIAPVILRTANGMAPARTGSIDELRVGNIVARNLKMVSAPGLSDLDVLGMNFLSQLQSWRVENNTLVLVPHHPQDVAARD